jgi:hypothetical protein
MNNTNTEEFDINEAALYIAQGTCKIVDAMKKTKSSETPTFEKGVEELSKKSKLEQEISIQEFDEERTKLRERFRRKRS